MGTLLSTQTGRPPRPLPISGYARGSHAEPALPEAGDRACRAAASRRPSAGGPCGGQSRTAAARLGRERQDPCHFSHGEAPTPVISAMAKHRPLSFRPEGGAPATMHALQRAPRSSAPPSQRLPANARAAVAEQGLWAQTTLAERTRRDPGRAPGAVGGSQRGGEVAGAIAAALPGMLRAEPGAGGIMLAVLRRKSVTKSPPGVEGP